MTIARRSNGSSARYWLLKSSKRKATRIHEAARVESLDRDGNADQVGRHSVPSAERGLPIRRMGLRRVDLRGLRDRLHPPTGLAKNNATKAFGTPGTLDLTGRNLYGNYDACPAYNIQNFMSNGATLGKVTSFENDLHVVSCYQ